MDMRLPTKEGRALASRITAAQRETFLASLAEGNSPEKAARSAETSRRSILRLRQQDEHFKLEYHDAYEAGVDMVEQALLDMAVGREQPNAARVAASCAVLNARRSDLYRRNARIEHEVKVPRTRRLANLSEEELRDLERLLGKAERA
jgi:hypothetical protein